MAAACSAPKAEMRCWMQVDPASISAVFGDHADDDNEKYDSAHHHGHRNTRPGVALRPGTGRCWGRGRGTGGGCGRGCAGRRSRPR